MMPKTHKARLITLLISTVLIITACAQRETVDLGSGCDFAGADEVRDETFSCGTIKVPLNYDAPEGETLDLTYIVKKANGEEVQSDPVLVLAGGPGDSGVIMAYSDAFESLRLSRDVVFFAQRGTLYGERLSLEECTYLYDENRADRLIEANDNLNNPEVIDPEQPFTAYLGQYSAQIGVINEACFQAFADNGADPTQFTTLNNARDIDRLMRTLGYDRYNIYAVDYGTRLALELIRNLPESGVRSVVLDSPIPPSADYLSDFVRSPHDAVMRLFALCEADAVCNADYPDLQTRTADLLNRLEGSPISIDDENSITMQNVVDQLTDLSQNRAIYMPRMIHELERGITETYVALRDGVVGRSPLEPDGTKQRLAELAQLFTVASTAEEDNNIISGIGDALNTAFGENAPAVDALEQVENLQDTRDAFNRAFRTDFANFDALDDSMDAVERIERMSDAEFNLLINNPLAQGNVTDDPAVAQEMINALTRDNAQYMHRSIICREEIISETALDDALAVYGTLDISQLGRSGIELAQEYADCTDYPVGDAPDYANAPLNGEVVDNGVIDVTPMLLFYGEYDTEIPQSTVESLLSELTIASLVVVPDHDHAVWGKSSCVRSIGSAFFDDPEADLDTSCLQGELEFFAPDIPLLSRS